VDRRSRPRASNYEAPPHYCGGVPARATNVALLLLVPAAVLTGGVAFLIGSGPVAIVTILHAVIGRSLVCRVPWKSVIARRGLRRRRADRYLSLFLALAVLLALLSGLAHSTGLLVRADGIAAMQVHVGAALVALVPLAIHIWRRPIRLRRTDLSRRNVLRLGLLGIAAGSGYAVLETLTDIFSLPGAGRRDTGSYERSSGDPNGMPSTSWLSDDVPAVDPVTWRVVVSVGGTTRSWSVEQLRAFGHTATVILDCTGGWWSRQVWSGARLSVLLPPGRTGTAAVSSVTGYSRRLPLTDDLLLAVDVGGAPLSDGHGSPVRLVVPGRRGFHWVKCVDHVAIDDRPWWLESPFPLQ
jgi:hypothetical protein